MSAEQRLQELGITLPEVAKPSHSYVKTRRSGTQLWVSGHTPLQNGTYAHLGKVGAEVSLDEARAEARVCVVNLLAAVRAALGSLDQVAYVIKVVGFVASAPDFYEQPKVMNAASDLLVEIFGEDGRHARSAIGVAVLPGNVPVEIEMVVEVKA
jgi:enamine deaminase RidA (YjgF/YER057c/UK114 family)